MPTIRKMIEEFTEVQAKHSNNARVLLLGDLEYSLIQQEELNGIIDRNIIKTTNKEIINCQIQEAMNASFERIPGFKQKLECKKTYIGLSEFLNNRYGFQISLDDLNNKPLGTSEERCLYLLRENEQARVNGSHKSLAVIAMELGCSVRALQKDMKQMTEQGFRLLGLEIKLVDQDQSIRELESTTHPVILMQNVTQLIAILEGLRIMSSKEAFRNTANSVAIDVWNQLSEYARNQVLNAIERMHEDEAVINWYFSIDREGEWQNRFISEHRHLDDNPRSKLMYLMKEEKVFHLTYKDDLGQDNTIFDCTVYKYLMGEELLIVDFPNGRLKLNTDRIVEISFR